MIKYLSLLLLLFILFSCHSSKKMAAYGKAGHYATDSLWLTCEQDSLRILNTGDYLVHSPYGNWELYVSGNPAQLGYKEGMLAQQLFRQQQAIFMDKLETMVSSKIKRRFIINFLHWYGRKMDRYIPEPYLTELYTLSKSLDNTYAYAGDNFRLLLFMHAAHDLGHALRDLAIVGCSSVASWGSKTVDGKLLIGRNFDFYVNDAFAENKVVYFVRPEQGIPYMSVSWAGMIGVVSGMNLQGLTVTMNAGKSSIPLSAKKPISIVAREILEKASTIAEAVAIAEQSQVFVSESLMIGSANDKKAVLLELSPKHMDVFEVDNAEQIICTNHFQSAAYQNDPRNLKHIQNSHSQYRYERLSELLWQQPKLNPAQMADILRNKEGLNDAAIGYGNDKAVNHLLAHHALIFQPEDRLVWVSNAPYQLGAFTAYDLNKVFHSDNFRTSSQVVDSLLIQADPFLFSTGYQQYEEMRRQSDSIPHQLHTKGVLTAGDIQKYQELNPHLWMVYYLSGKYWMANKAYSSASAAFEQALQCLLPTIQTERKILKLKAKADKKWKQ